MKKIYTLFLSLGISFGVFAQTSEKCGTMHNYSSMCEKDPEYAKKVWQAEQSARNWKAQNAGNAKVNSTLVIPVVFHCVYKSTSDPTYLHDSVFQRQIMVLNETYSKSNPNYVNTRPVFDTMGANTDIQFCFASVDPNGNPTNGINRVQSSTTFSTTVADDGVKDPTAGGVAPWDSHRYLNIWTCDMSLFGFTFVLGYATFPGTDSTKDGVVLQYQYVGYQSGTGVNNLGRTAVHEVGHWLGMRHIWGDGQQSSTPCDSTDYVDDTPNADAASQTTCDTARNSCSNESTFWSQFGIDPPDMVENYMDYSNDACMTMFTKGQKARMWSFINTLRTGLLSNPVSCNPVGISDAVFSANIHVFPNPAKDIINLNFTGGDVDHILVEFYNTSGQLIKTHRSQGFQSIVNVADVPAGLYFIKISNGSNLTVKKIILE